MLTHNRLGASTWKQRPSRLGATGKACFDWVVTRKRRHTIERSPIALIRLAIRFSLTCQPSAHSARVILGLPDRRWLAW
jgi:hypothetical protein